MPRQLIEPHQGEQALRRRGAERTFTEKQVNVAVRLPQTAGPNQKRR